MSVPLASDRDAPPPGGYEIAAEYLLAEARLNRRESTLDVALSRVGTRTIDLDFSLPEGGGADGTWYVPLVFLSKEPVAPDLEVLDAGGTTIPIPTKRENMALTVRALGQLVEDGTYQLQAEQGEELVAEVVRSEVLQALTANLILLDAEPPPSPELVELLAALEDQFVLWVPVHGAPGSQHHCRIIRREMRQVDPILASARARKSIVVALETAIGEVRVRFKPISRWLKLRRGAALRRFLNAFALRAIEFRETEAEASRASSFHLRVHAPEGFLVRNVRAAALGPAGIGPAVSAEIETGPHAVVQGYNSDVAHVHLSERDNPPGLYVRVTLALHGGMTTLWMVAAALSAGLLWLVHHHLSYGPAEEQNRQIAAAVLLVVPAFASAYSLRAEGNELLRTVLAGARGLLLVSAALSVASALALAGLTPSGVSRHDAIEIYASADYFVAVPLVCAWVLSGRLTWLLFRYLLGRQDTNLLVEMAIGAAVLCLGLLPGIPERICGGLLLVLGLALAAIAANSAAEPLSSAGAAYRKIAGGGGVALISAAGCFLGFFGGESTLSAMREICAWIGLALMMTALAALVWGASEPGASAGQLTQAPPHR